MLICTKSAPVSSDKPNSFNCDSNVDKTSSISIFRTKIQIEKLMILTEKIDINLTRQRCVHSTITRHSKGRKYSRDYLLPETTGQKKTPVKLKSWSRSRTDKFTGAKNNKFVNYISSIVRHLLSISYLESILVRMNSIFC